MDELMEWIEALKQDQIERKVDPDRLNSFETLCDIVGELAKQVQDIKKNKGPNITIDSDVCVEGIGDVWHIRAMDNSGNAEPGKHDYFAKDQDINQWCTCCYNKRDTGNMCKDCFRKPKNIKPEEIRFDKPDLADNFKCDDDEKCCGICSNGNNISSMNEFCLECSRNRFLNEKYICKTDNYEHNCSVDDCVAGTCTTCRHLGWKRSVEIDNQCFSCRQKDL